MTLLNRQAYKIVLADYSAYCSFEQEELDFKNEGRVVGYLARLNGKEFTAVKPDWLK